MKSELRITERLDPEAIVIEGELTKANAASLEGRLGGLKPERGRVVTVDLSGLDIDDGLALAVAINCLRELSGRATRLVITGAPQMLGHNLYRVGLLEGGSSIELVDMRLDEPAGF